MMLPNLSNSENDTDKFASSFLRQSLQEESTTKNFGIKLPKPQSASLELSIESPVSNTGKLSTSLSKLEATEESLVNPLSPTSTVPAKSYEDFFASYKAKTKPKITSSPKDASGSRFEKLRSYKRLQALKREE